MSSICFFSSKSYDCISFGVINKTHDHQLTFIDDRLSPETIHHAQGHDSVCLFVNDVADAAMMAKLAEQGIKLIVLRCAGFNNIDLEAAKQHNIKVLRVPAYSPYAVAEHALGLILSLNRRIVTAANRTRSYNFSIEGLEGFDLYGKTIGIVGTGKIGLILAQICKGLGMTVLAYDLYPNHAESERIGFTYTTLPELYQQSAIISLHCPLTPETTHMINAQTIAQMKDGVMIINTGRGKLINTSDLIQELKTKKIGHAGLDVYEGESAYFFDDHSGEEMTDPVLKELLSFENVVLTSHQAFFTHEALENIANVTLTNVSDFFAGKDVSKTECR